MSIETEAPDVRMVASRDGTGIACWLSGDGPPLVLVHGTTADHSRMAGLSTPLGDRFRLCAIDRRGRGRSGDAEPYEIEREFEDVAAVVDSFGEPASLFGHSYGALCALEAALLTSNLRRMVLYEPVIPSGATVYPPGVLDRLERLANAGDRETLVRAFFTDVVRMPADEVEMLRSSPVWPARLAAALTIVRECRAEETYRFEAGRLLTLRVPTLFLVGGDSPAFLREGIDLAAAVIPRARVSVMPGQHHIAMDTAPDLFLRELTGFLADG